MAEHKFSSRFYTRFFIQELYRIKHVISYSKKLKFRLGIFLFSSIYTLCTGFAVYVNDYDAGDQALIPMFISLVGVAIFSLILIIAAIVARLQNKREWSREFGGSLLFMWLIYAGVLTLFAKFTS